MHNYSLAMESLINEIGAEVYRKDYWENGDSERKFGPIKNSPVPFIPCQYHGIVVSKLPNGRYPGGNLYPDKSWEGARATGSGARRRVEFYGGFNVIKDSKGRCLIPDTPNNRKRLEMMSGGVKQQLVTELFTDAKGVQRSKRVMKSVAAKPLYTIIAGEAANGNLEEMIRLAAEKIVREREEKAALPPDEVVSVEPVRVELDPGIVDERDLDHGQPSAPAGGEGQAASPPASGPQPPTSRRRQAPPSFSPNAVENAVAATGDEY